MKEEEFFSIVIPVYNREKLVKATITSVLNQSFQSLEIIIVDDGSTDNSASIIKGIKSDRVKYFHIENSERGAARNFGIGKSKSKYVILFDSDDLMDSNHLQVLHDHLVKKEVNFIATKFFWEDEMGSRKYYSDLKNLEQGIYNYKLFLSGNFLACNICFKRSNSHLVYFQESRELSIMEDWIFLLQNLKRDSILIVDQYTIIQRDHPNRSMVIDNKLVIKRKLNALKWLQTNCQFSKSELKELWSNGYYFIALHHYLDGNFSEGVNYLLKSLFRGRNLKKNLILGMKLIAGKRNINKLIGK